MPIAVASTPARIAQINERLLEVLGVGTGGQLPSGACSTICYEPFHPTQDPIAFARRMTVPLDAAPDSLYIEAIVASFLGRGRPGPTRERSCPWRFAKE